MIFKYSFAWLGMMLLAIANGGLRDCLYKPRLGDLAAHQLSTVLLFLLLTAYFWVLVARWPPTSAVQAWTIGFIWLVLTVAFEFGFGRYIAGHPWCRIFFDYNILAGRIWVLIPLWVLIAPTLFFHLRR